MLYSNYTCLQWSIVWKLTTFVQFGVADHNNHQHFFLHKIHNYYFNNLLCRLFISFLYYFFRFANICTGAQTTHPLIRTSQVSLSSNPDADFRYSTIFTPIGLYKGQLYAIKKVRKKSIDITREMKKELKMVKSTKLLKSNFSHTLIFSPPINLLDESFIPFPLQIRDLRHDNICAFIGACTDPPNICVITEYCTRGSLRVSKMRIVDNLTFTTSSMRSDFTFDPISILS